MRGHLRQTEGLRDVRSDLDTAETDRDEVSAAAPTPRFVTAKVVARVFDLTTQQVYALVRQGILPVVHLGRALRFDVRELEEFAKAGGRGFEYGWRKDAPE